METKKIIIAAYFLAIIFACIYVPWKAEIQGSYLQVSSVSLRYSFIWSPPVQGMAVVDFQRVVLEIVGITALFGLAIVLVGGLKK